MQDVGGSVREFYEANMAIARAPWVGGMGPPSKLGPEQLAEL